MKVLVLGAGVVGATAAYWLARDGHDVTVLERREGPGLEASFANGGQISVGHAVPWAGPATPWQALRWLGKADAPLLFRPRLDPALWKWSLRFLGQCTRARARINIERTLRIAAYSRSCLDALRAETGIDYDAKTDGIVYVYRDADTLAGAVRDADTMREFGLDLRALAPSDIVALDPAFAARADGLAGGLYSPDDESGNAHTFTVEIAQRAKALGARFETGVAVERLEAEGGAVSGVVTDKGRFTADRYVVSLGAQSPLALRPLGLDVPIYPAKGYSVTLPISDPAKAPSVSLTDDEKKLVYSRLGDTLRVAGTAEFVGYDTSIDDVRARSILNAALEMFPGCGEAEHATFWAGLRPKTPDSVPLLGATPFANLLLNTGHGTLGWTMACGSARVIADLVAGRAPDISLDGLGLDRFG